MTEENQNKEDMNDTQVPKAVQKTVDKIKEQILEATKCYIGQKNDSATWDAFKKTIYGELNKFGQARTEVFTKTLWSTFTLWQKMTWWLTRKICNREIRLYDNIKQYLYQKTSINDENFDKRNYDVTMSDIDEFEKRFKKWFYESDPKSVLLCTLNLFPVKPLECIEMNFTIGPK